MKILNAGPGFSVEMTEEELLDFLSESKINLHVGTLDQDGYPNIHPVWYTFDMTLQRIYFNTSRTSKKFINLFKNPLVYFCIDSCTPPYKGVRGKGKIGISDDMKKNIPIAEKILVKYVGDFSHPIASNILNSIKKNDSVIVEITPNYYSTWDDGKIKW